MALTRRTRSVLQALVPLVLIVFFYVTFTFYFDGHGWAQLKSITFGSEEQVAGDAVSNTSTAHPSYTATSDVTQTTPNGHPYQTSTPPATSTSHQAIPQQTANATLLEQAAPYVDAIMNPADTTFSRLECPEPNLDRYAHLRDPPDAPINVRRPRYFFALDLHQSISILPRLLGTIISTMRYLGPENCVLSIVEGRSTDGTYEVLHSLAPALHRLGTRYIFQTSPLDPLDPSTDRITALAALRQRAVQDLTSNPSSYHPNTTVIFANDVALCVDDVLELLHQRIRQRAHMTCAMDWTYVGPDPTFYDVWIARGMTGDTFFRIPDDGSWDRAWDLFWNDEGAREAWGAGRPFQVFSCWNGVAVFTAEPLMRGKVGFRGSGEGECWQGEPKLFAKDMWWRGYGRIAVVPSVNVEYSDEAGRKIKELKGYTGSNVQKEGGEGLIEWEKKPPDLVK
ncbi:hypothetical protein EJ04DRAFT_474474, partial [Polyplosphaeria fusca]